MGLGVVLIITVALAVAIQFLYKKAKYIFLRINGLQVRS